jgi:hypothetical protein
MRIGKGKPEIGQGSGIGRRRVEKIRVLSLASDIAWDRVGAADAGGRLGSGT